MERQPKKTVEKIREAVSKLALDPPVGDITVLKGYPDNRRRLRVGSLRIIYKYSDENNIKSLIIIDAGNRGDIYK